MHTKKMINEGEIKIKVKQYKSNDHKLDNEGNSKT